MAKFPRSITVGPDTYLVQRVPQEAMEEEEDVFGLLDVYEQRILIEDVLDDETALVTLLHEAIHAIIELHYGLIDKPRRILVREKLVEILGVELTQTILNSPDLQRFIRAVGRAREARDKHT